MKYIFLVVISLFLISESQAQEEHPIQKLKELQQKFQSHQNGINASSAKTANSYRIYAFNVEVNDNGVMVNYDSAFIEYNGDLGGDLFSGDIFYDKAYTYSWDGFIYENNRRLTRTYTATNKLDDDLAEIWDGAMYNNEYKYTHTYDPNDNLESRTSQVWNGNNWEYTWRYIYTYTPDNLEQSRTYQMWNGSSWDNQFRDVSSYNSNKSKLSETRQQYSGGTWVNDWRSVFTYNADELLTVELVQDWVVGSWEDDIRYAHVYDANNNLISRTYQTWLNSNWENNSRRLYDYTGNDLMEVINQDYNNNNWEYIYKEEYTYDVNGNVSKLISYDWDGTIWNMDSRYRIYYESYVGINNIIADKEIEIYPNPFMDKVKFNLKDSNFNYLGIYDLSGREIYKAKFNGDEQVILSTSEFPAGIYFYRLEGKSSVRSGKLVKQ